MRQVYVESLLMELESLVGRELEVCRSLIRGGELDLAFEQLCTVATDEPIRLSASTLVEMRNVAATHQNPDLVAQLKELPIDERRRRWMDQRPAELARSGDEELWSLAASVRRSRTIQDIVELMHAQLNRAPFDVEVARLLRMVSPKSPYEVVADAVIALILDRDADTAQELFEWSSPDS